MGAALTVAMRTAWAHFRASGYAWLAPVGAFALYFLGTVFLAVLKPGSERTFLAYWDPIAVPIQAGAVITCLWCARRIRQESPWAGAGWLLIGVAVFVYMLGDVVWTNYEVLQGVEVPTPSWADLFYVAFYLPLLAGTLCFLKPLSDASKARLLLDSALLTSAASVLSWYYLVGPLWRQSDTTVLGKGVNIAYCLGDLVVLVCVVALMSSARLTRGSRLAMATFASGLLAMSIADASYWLATASGRYQSGQWGDLGWNAGCSLIACAPLIAARAPATPSGAFAPPSTPRVRVQRSGSLRAILPYLLALTALALVLREDLQDQGSVGLGVFVVGLAFMGLVIVRQVFAYSDNLRLYHDVALLNVQLADSNAELSEARQHADEMAEQARAATDAKSRFLASMSHEIRTPLNGVTGMAGLLLGTALDEQQEHYARTIVYSADLLLSLINDILDFSKIEAGMMQIEEAAFDLRDAVEGVLETFAVQAHKKGLDLIADVSADAPQSMVGDGHRLRQVLCNLLSNALKFTERGQVVLRYRWQAVGAERGEARFSVQDSGPGIDPDALGRLFTSFSQADASTTRRYGGTGLGLAISKRLVELMGGTIGVESTLGQGATFWFSLPLRRGAIAAPALPGAEGIPDLRQARVLVVDDNTVNRQVLRAQLTRWGIRSESAADGSRALALLGDAVGRQQPFHVALVDHQMPGMDGLELAQAARSDPSLHGLVLILLTSVGDDLDRQQRNALGIWRVLAKPVRQSALLDALMDSLHLSYGQRDQQSRVPGSPATYGPPLSQDLRILLAEDNETNQLVAQAVLQKSGLRCDIAVNGVEAAEFATTRSYDLVLMDCQMPELDGYAATRRIRAHEARTPGRRVPVVALTASATVRDREKCLAAGMDDYLTKPVTPESLIVMVGKWASPGHQSPTPASAPLLGEETDLPAGVLPVDAPFQYEAALARCSGSVPLLHKIVGKFLESMPDELRGIEDALAREDAPAVAAHAHKLKGGAATLSAEPLATALAALEEVGREGRLAEIPEQSGRVRQEAERFAADAAELIFAGSADSNR